MKDKPNKTIYFYHTQDTHRILREWEAGKFQSHFLYGAIELREMGYDVIYHDQIHIYKRVQDTLRATWRILTCRKKYDVLYATHTRGIEPIVLLHAIGIFRPRIVVWHHQPIVRAKSSLREALARLFYKGLDEMIFFSEKLLHDSLKAEKANPARMHVVPWGADMRFYSKLLPSLPMKADAEEKFFISTGKELRDNKTLIEAFNRTGLRLTLFAEEKKKAYIESLGAKSNIDIHYGNRLIPYELSLIVAQSRCVCICCEPSNYTVGLTTVVEALALGLPILCTRNEQMPMDIEKEGCGIWLPPHDVNAWAEAIRHIESHPEEAEAMGRRSRILAEEKYNATNCAAAVAKIIG